MSNGTQAEMPRSKGSLADQPHERSDESWVARVRHLIAGTERLLTVLEQRYEQEHAWHEERELFRAMIDQVPDYLFVKDRQSRFVVANKAVAADLACEPEALIGKTDFDLHPQALASKFFADEQTVIATGRPTLDIEEFVVPPSGGQRWLSTSKVPLRNSIGQVIGIVGISRDVTDRKSVEAQIQHLAHHDPLTGLPNRSLLLDRLRQAIAKAERDAISVSVVFVDLDKFKGVNDTLGHNAGDCLLRTLADRMMHSVRATDTVGRLSGDEFIILLEEEERGGQTRALSLVKRLQAAILEPVDIGGHAVRVSCSTGVATYPQDATDPDALLINADTAMYRAKERGRDAYEFYSSSMHGAQEKVIASRDKRQVRRARRSE